MKRLSWTLILPLTIISFSIFTKWWYVLPVDAPDSMMYGFPFPYACNGWHTSMSFQIFILELLIDILIHFSFWFIILFLINRFLINVRIHKFFIILLFSIAGTFATTYIIIASDSNNLVFLKRTFDVEILKTGYRFVWDRNSRPENFDFDQYELNKKRK